MAEASVLWWGSLRQMWRSKLLLESSITCSQEDHTMCPKQLRATFRTVSYMKATGAKSVTPKHGGPGSVVHWHLEYEKISDEGAHPETLLQFCVEISKEIDEHLLNEE
ncbi:hypothetical protein F2Q69_00020485 [Brassica cretica]|uniref:Bet v I/Major latex protein domain-containing protein n=1 Tax=Brassica cretica TaxID=69181 RepID=A0A8S9QNN3_BRACR|nr:hypothetical protein F2Q69_00020485 [Brassica cretica]